MADEGMTLDRAVEALEAEPTSVERKAILAVAREVRALRDGGKSKKPGGKSKAGGE